MKDDDHFRDRITGGIGAIGLCEKRLIGPHFKLRQKLAGSNGLVFGKLILDDIPNDAASNRAKFYVAWMVPDVSERSGLTLYSRLQEWSSQPHFAREPVAINLPMET